MKKFLLYLIITVVVSCSIIYKQHTAIPQVFSSDTGHIVLYDSTFTITLFKFNNSDYLTGNPNYVITTGLGVWRYLSNKKIIFFCKDPYQDLRNSYTKDPYYSDLDLNLVYNLEGSKTLIGTHIAELKNDSTLFIPSLSLLLIRVKQKYK